MKEETQILWEPGGTEVTTAVGTARRYRKPLRQLCVSDLRVLLVDTYEEWYKHKAPRLSAALAFYTALSLAPLLIVVIAVAGFFFGLQAAQGQIVWQIQGLVGQTSALAIQGVLEGARKPVTGSLAAMLGVVLLVFTATTVVAELRDSLNTIWGVPVTELQGFKSILLFVRERFFSFALVLGVGFLLLVSLCINAGLAAAGTALSGYISAPEWIAQATSTLVSLIVATGLFGLVYRIIPDVDLEWRDVALGAFITSLLFNTGKLVVGMYLGKTSLASTYGAAGSLVVCLFWVYCSALIFLGAEFTQVFCESVRLVANPARPAAAPGQPPLLPIHTSSARQVHHVTAARYCRPEDRRGSVETKFLCLNGSVRRFESAGVRTSRHDFTLETWMNASALSGAARRLAILGQDD
jgi:membrane protein